MPPEKKGYSPEEVKVLIDINTSLVNITNALTTMKETMDDLVEMEKKHGTDLQLFNERMKFLQGLYNTLSEVVDDIKAQLTTLTTQLDYKERTELQANIIKQREKEKNKNAVKEVKEVKEKKDIFPQVIKFFGAFAKNAKWIALIVVVVATIIIFILGGNEALKAVSDFWTSIFTGGKK